MMTFARSTSWAALALAGLASGFIAGCASSSESAARDTLTENVGKYDPAPRGVNKPRVGIPAFSVKSASGSSLGGSSAALDDLAADQMSTLLDNSERFTVIERVQLQKLLDEQNMEGIVRPGEMAKTGQVRGVDYLLLGKVTNLRVKNETRERGFGLATIGGLINTGGADVKKKDQTITTECGVDIRLVNPSTGEVLASNFSEYKKTDSVSAMGLKVLGADANADAEMSMDEDDKGKILRLALDDAVRKSLPKIDRFLKSDKNAGGSGAGSNTGPAADSAAEPTGTPAVATQAPANGSTAAKPAAAKPANSAVQLAKKFCPNCGTEVAAGSKFCSKDGTKIE